MTTSEQFPGPLPAHLQNRLNLIVQTVPLFWEQRPYNHFTNHGPAHSERVHRQKLGQLAQELPESRRLNSDEVFIVSAAAWLYETGMQSPNLRSILDFDYRPGEPLSPTQLAEIREKKHLLTECLILDSVRNDYHGSPLQLGLTRPADDYTRAIAAVCRWCSSEPLEQVPDKLLVHGVEVRLRLMVALLRLADQLYIDSSRVKLELLKPANLPLRQFARWWAYHYAQALPIVNGQIRFYYYLPVTQKEYLGHIRALIEPEFEKNPTITYLWDQGLRLIPDKTPTVQFDQPKGFQQEMGDDLADYLRREVTPVETPEISPPPVEGVAGRSLLVLDYENLVLQLGQEGYFFSIDQISRLVVSLLKEARTQCAGPVYGLAVGHWSRPDLADIARILRERVYTLLSLEVGESSSDKLRQELTQRLNGPNAPKRVILVAPAGAFAPVVQEFVDSKQAVDAWISDLSDAEIYQAIVQDPKSLRSLLKLAESKELDSAAIETCQTTCILRLDDKMTQSQAGVSLEEITVLLNQVEQANNRASWWQLWLINRGIIVLHGSPQQCLFQLNLKNETVIQVLEVRKAVLETLRAMSPGNRGVRQDQLVDKLNRRDCFRGLDAAKYLEQLKDAGLVHLDMRQRSSGGQPLWSANTSQSIVFPYYADFYLPQFTLALDHVLLREGRPFLHEHNLQRRLAPQIDDSVFQLAYRFALSQGWVRRRKTDELVRGRDEPKFNVSVVEDAAQVEKTRRHQDIFLNFLFNKSVRNGIERDALWQRLSQIRTFTLQRDEFDQWITLLERDSIVVINRNAEQPGKDIVKLDFESSPLLLYRLLGRMNIYGLIRNIRLMNATRPENKKPARELKDRLAKFVTGHDDQLAEWVYEYAKMIKLVEETISPNDLLVCLNQHHLVRGLDLRESSSCQALVELMKKLARHYPDEWVPRYIVIQEMEKDNRQFGFPRGEHDYWIDQAVYHRKLLEEKKDYDSRRMQSFIRVKSSK